MSSEIVWTKVLLNGSKSITQNEKQQTTRMFTAGMGGNDVNLLDPPGRTSHFNWKDPEHITAWSKPMGMKHGFYEFRNRSRDIRRVGKGVVIRNGHNTFLPGTNPEWILSDTYTVGKAREQIPYLFHS